MSDGSPSPQQKKSRKSKTELESRSFRDGAIYLFRRADYKKPTWFCRVKIPGAKGYISQSTKTTNEHAAYKFADDLFHKGLVTVANGQDLHSKKVVAAITEYAAFLERTERDRARIELKLQLLERIKTFFLPMRLKEVNTKVLSELLDWLHKNSRRGALSQNSIHRYTSEVRQFLNWCVERAFIDRPPRFPKVRAENNRRPHFDRDDYAKLVTHLREFVKANHPRTIRDRTMLANYVMVLVSTGIRVGEARTLKWRDIREIPSPTGRTRPPDIVLFVTGKTGPREVVASTHEVKEHFKAILALRIEELGRKPHNEGYVFCNRDGSPIGSFKKSFAALLKAAEVEFDRSRPSRWCNFPSGLRS